MMGNVDTVRKAPKKRRQHTVLIVCVCVCVCLGFWIAGGWVIHAMPIATYPPHITL